MKYKVGTSYTVWVDVEADSHAEAIERAVKIDFGLTANPNVEVSLNEFDDHVVYTHEALGI